jgi:hypothetical protein
MQTFLTHKKHGRTAGALDMMRLGRQRDDARRILRALLHEDPEGDEYANDPAVEMWSGYERELVYYGLTVCYEWSVTRQFKDNVLSWFRDKAIELGCPPEQLTSAELAPPWVSDVWVLRSHRSNLIRKMPHHYGPLFPSTPENMPFLWPVNDDLGGYQLRVSIADMERIERGERVLPPELRMAGEWVEQATMSSL